MAKIRIDRIKKTMDLDEFWVGKTFDIDRIPMVGECLCVPLGEDPEDEAVLEISSVYLCLKGYAEIDAYIRIAR